MNALDPILAAETDAAAGAIAIVGMAGRFPGADTVAQFWRNIRDGRDAIRRFRDEELEDAFDARTRASAAYVKARPILDGVDQFDAGFFGMYPREAALTDPQQRLFLELAWEALEDAGCDPATFPGAIGVVAACSMNTYFLHHVLGERRTIEDFTSSFQVGNYAMLTGAGLDFLATRLAYKLDLRGPAITVATACSSSLLAVAQACQALQLFQADLMLAGGISISFPQKRGYLHQEGGMVSPDGVCRPFDAKAGGTVFGSGGGIVALKRLEDALRDGDTIHAVIRGAAINNDGAGKVGFTAPSVDGQAAVIAAAHAVAGVEADTIGYVECHGTATPLGDPIEFAGLVKAFRATSDGKGFCALGSAKANVGHLDAGAGVTGLIKAALTVREGEIPPLLNFATPNPGIALESSPFYVNTAPAAWRSKGTRRRAGVSAFGVGGTNVHLVLEEAPPCLPPPAAAAPAGLHVLPISARSPAALAAAATRLADRLDADPALPLADVAWTLQTGRRAFEQRAAVVAAGTAEAARALRAGVKGSTAPAEAPPVVFLFPGQGAQHPGMGRALYRNEPVFRDIVDRGAGLLEPLLGQDLRRLLYDETATGGDGAHPIRWTVVAQPALFLIEYATARLWMSRGIRPAAMVGHSVGEFAAAALAGVMSFEDGLTLIAERGRLMQGMPGGAMLAVRLPEAELQPLLPPEVDIAAINAPSMCVAAGPHEAIAALEQALAGRDVQHRRLHTSHAFHSAMMDPVVAPLAERAAKMRFESPSIPYVSAVTGAWITAAEATAPDFWARHCRAPVRFAAALATAVAGAKPVLLEVGPGKTLTSLAAQAVPKDAAGALIASLPEANADVAADRAFAEATGRLWAAGVAPDWRTLHPTPRRRISLPTYPFERQRHWIEAPRRAAEAAAPAISAPAAAEAPAIFTPDEAVMNAPAPLPTIAPSRKPRLAAEIARILEDLSGDKVPADGYGTSFLELGFDSLFLAQVATALQKAFGIKITFRQLLNDYPAIDSLADHLDATLPPDPAPSAAASAAADGRRQIAAADVPMPVAAAQPVAFGAGVEGLMQQQLQAMQSLIAQQLQVLSGTSLSGVATPHPAAGLASDSTSPSGRGEGTAAPAVTSPQRGDVDSPAGRAGEGPSAPVVAAVPLPADDTPSRFSVYKPGGGAKGDLTPAQHAFIDDLVRRYTARTPGSKASTDANRPALADPRAAAGFRQEWKEMVYPIVSDRSKGSKIWDVDGNEYVDLVNGYGQTAFGHAPDFVLEAVSAQMAQGFAIGPQTPLAYDVATMFAEMTGNERVTFCNTGSEAVMAAMRVARTVTGRDRVVVFNGAYHGQFDEVLTKAGGRNGPPKALPVAPGIPAESVSNMVVLPYGKPESLEWIRANAPDLAAVVVETVQSRHPNLRPKEFLEELRRITAASETALVFDEVVTGFRVHPGGMQAVFGIRADMATYGKVVGGGMPIGVLAGRARFMDALDGGQWRYGDESFPEIAPTFFAGTFVRHPLVMAAARAVLNHLKAEGPALQERLTARTEALVGRLNAELDQRGIKTRAETYASWFYLNFSAEDRLGTLFFNLMRLNGVHIQDGFPCFLTTAHSDEDIERIFRAVVASLDELQRAGILAPADAPVPAPPPEPALAAPLPDEVPMTEPQAEVWMAAQLGDEASCSFNEGVTVRFDGALDTPALVAALNDMVARHDALRACFGRSGKAMRVLPALTLDVPAVDLSTAPSPEAALADLVDEDARTPFDLAKGPLVRARLATLGPSRHALVLTGHHIVCDGWSMNVMLSELAACYAARRDGKAPDLPAPMPFRRYALDQNAAGPRPATETFWRAEFAAPPPVLDMPSDRPRPAQKSFRGATWRDQIDAELYRAVKKSGARQGATLFVTLFAALQVLVSRLSGQDDVVIAVPTAGQSLVDDAVLVGHAVNFLPVRAPIAPGATFADHLQQAKKRVLEAYEHQDYTLGTLVRTLGLKRDPARLPLTDIQFNLEKLAPGLEFPGLTAGFAPNPKAFSNYDLFLNFIESDTGLRIDVDYNTDLFDEATIARWLGHLRTLLAAIAADPAERIATLPLLAEDERRSLLAAPAAARDYDDRPVPALVAAQAARTPDAVAVIRDREALTYGELERRANRLAHHLRQVVPEPGARIALATERSLDMVVALLAIMKAGHAYVPLDPTHPAARLGLVLDNAAVAALIADSPETAAIAPSGLPVVRLDADAEAIAACPDAALPAPAGDATAYVIFTSGSTGTPKGVEITHHALTNLLWSMARKPGFGASDTLVAVTTVSFDIAGLELYLPLVTGGRLVIAGRDEVKGGFGLVKLIDDSGATVVQATPSLWRILLEAGFKPRPGLTMLAGGEALPRDLADKLLANGAELWNVYGPTETTIWSSAGRVTPGSGPITIGEPVLNTTFHVLDRGGRLAPTGVPGELHIGGDGLARGYFMRPDLTAAAFRDVTLDDGHARRLYATGDLARRLPDGQIQLLGRADQQVKLRGFRIELEEIEAVLRAHPAVAGAAVRLTGESGGAQRLAGYYVEAAGAAVEPAALAAHAAASLPDYMVPALWAKLAALPLSPSGKLDRKALPEPDPSAAVAGRAIVAPRNPTEERLAAIWREVLGLREVGVEDNLFALGADSIHLFRIAAKMIEQGIGLEARHLLRHPTIAELALAEPEAAGKRQALPSLKSFRRPAREPSRVTT
ncbi:MAG TPA: amino acid adenylation domain-containing protein [Hyphomicrobiales bacterium]|nr:amino acid adenylation domain-containing protein [Hyphomicrobiales bacterium]